jgi:hypothetical protein
MALFYHFISLYFEFHAKVYNQGGGRSMKQIGFSPASLRIVEAAVLLFGRPFGQRTMCLFTSATDIDSKIFKDQ